MAYYRSARERFLPRSPMSARSPSRPRTPTRSPSTTARSAAGPPNARPSAGPTTTSASSPGSRHGSGGADGARGRHLERLGDLALPDGAQAGGHPSGGPARVREQARSSSRAGGGTSQARAPPSRGRRAVRRRNGGLPRSRRRRPATSSSTSRAIRTRSMTAWTTCSACSRRTAPSTRSGRATTHEFSLDGERAAFERLVDFLMARLARPRPCTSTTTRRTSPPRSSG